MLQSILALTLTTPFPGLFLKSDSTVPLLSKLTEDLCLSVIGSTESWQTNNVFFHVSLKFCLLSPVEGEGDVLCYLLGDLGQPQRHMVNGHVLLTTCCQVTKYT